MRLNDIDWRITNLPDMKTFYVTFNTDDNTLQELSDWLADNKISLLDRSLTLSGPIYLGKTTIMAPASGRLQFENEHDASLFRLTWC